MFATKSPIASGASEPELVFDFDAFLRVLAADFADLRPPEAVLREAREGVDDGAAPPSLLGAVTSRAVSAHPRVFAPADSAAAARALAPLAPTKANQRTGDAIRKRRLAR